MTYEVFVQPSAGAEIEAAYAALAEGDLESADQGLEGLGRALESLQSMPLRCARASESPSAPYEVRQLLYSRHRILFTVQRRDVHVLHVRHARQQRSGI